MLDKAKYINSKGVEIIFGQLPYFINYSDLRDYKWTYTTNSISNKIRYFDTQITEKSFPVVVKAEDNEALDFLYETIDCDVRNNSKGKIYIGDYYLEGYFVASEKSEYLKSKGYAVVELKFVSEDSLWRKVTSSKFFTATDVDSNDDGFGYDYGYDYDYTIAASRSGNIINTATFESEFRVIINGYADSPSISIGDTDIGVDVEVKDGEYLIIDSAAKTIILTNIAGEKVNCFNYRDKDNYIFQKITAGNKQVLWNGDFEFTVELIEDRGEPKWQI